MDDPEAGSRPEDVEVDQEQVRHAAVDDHQHVRGQPRQPPPQVLVVPQPDALLRPEGRPPAGLSLRTPTDGYRG